MTLIIAEAGVNHNGDMTIAHKLIDAAKNAGADIVKFQSFKANNLASRSAQKAEYQLLLTEESESQQKMLKNLELSNENHIALIKHCKDVDIEFLTTAFDLDIDECVNSFICLGEIILRLRMYPTTLVRKLRSRHIGSKGIAPSIFDPVPERFSEFGLLFKFSSSNGRLLLQ